MKECVFVILLSITMETQELKAEMIISAYYRPIMCPYLTSSDPHHIVLHSTTVLQVHLDL